MRSTGFIFALLLSLAAVAQLPQVQLPQVGGPAVQLPGGVLPDAARGIGGTLRGLSGARALRADTLFRQHRAELDRDSRGELVIRAEVIAIDISEPALKRALDEYFVVKRTQELADLGVRITVLQTPEGWSATRGLKRLRKLDPEGAYDFNHVYLDGGEVSAIPVSAAAGGPPASGRVGLIDGGIDAGHEAFRGIRVQHSGCNGVVVPNPHGTAVAYLLTRSAGVGEIFSADVYCNLPTGGSIDAIAAAFGWMAREHIAVINVSLVGPRNALLERVVKTLVARGHLVVAAVGNDGPAAPPLYPAAYDGVIGVTAVDKQHKVLIESCRGKQVDFAAQGTDFEAATQSPADYLAVRGTSFAAPIIAALLARDLATPDRAQSERVFAKWSGLASDLGRPGRDDVYGQGELPAPDGVAEDPNK